MRHCLIARFSGLSVDFSLQQFFQRFSMKSGVWGRSIFVTTILLLCQKVSAVGGIDCYLCNSSNGSNPLCDDPFHTDNGNALVENCKSYKRDRSGVFPADHCIKIKGTAVNDHNHTIMVRTCALDSGTLTADTEIVRMSHCGFFILDSVYYKGCVQSCGKNGCNAGSTNLPQLLVVFLFTLAPLYYRDLRPL